LCQRGKKVELLSKVPLGGVEAGRGGEKA